MHKAPPFLALASIGFSGLLSAHTSESTVTAAFEKLRALRGQWEGTYVWSGARAASGTMGANYYITGNGSAVVENLTMGDEPSMTSVYHLDGRDLRMTHFCAAQNQPRLKAADIDPDITQVTFSFVDITNLRAPSAGHVEGLEVRFLEPDHIALLFRFKGDGKESDELIDLRRKK
jgi:hypothetical protein